MKHKALFFGVSMMVSNISVAGGSIELQLKEESEAVTAKFGGSNWFAVGQMTSSGYRQAYGGPVFNVTPELKIGAGIGLERTATESWGARGGVFTSFSNDHFSVFGLYEDGVVTDSFQKVVATKGVTPYVKLGAHYQSNIGFGPRVDIAPVKNVTVWGTYLNGDTALIGLRYKF